MTASARRRLIGGAIAILLLAVAFYLVSPLTPLEAARSYSLKVWEVRHASAFGSAESHPPSFTTWIGIPLALVTGRSAAATADEFFAENGRRIAQILRVAWACLAAFSVATACGLLRNLMAAGGVSSARTTRMAEAGLVLFLGTAPVLSLAVRDLLPSLPAALLLLLAWRTLLPERKGWFPVLHPAGLFAGLFLAWFPFLWPAALLLLLGMRLTREPWGRIAGACALAVVLGLVLEPSHLTRLASAPGRILLEWRREGGWGASEGESLLRFLTLAFALGPLAVVFWAFGYLFGSRSPRSESGSGAGRESRAPALFVAGLWLLLVLAPAASGARWPGAAQWSIAPLLAVSSVATVARPWPGRLGIASGLALLALVASVIPARFAMETRARAAVGFEQKAWRELRAEAGPADLWITDRPLASPAPDSTDAALMERGFLLPRDPRDPARYDFAYWPRWYAGFRWIAVSASRVRENLDRPQSSLPHVFYHALESQGVVQKEWGRGDQGNGIRLYRLADGAVWRRPLTETELDGIHGGPQLTWFISQIGSLYLAEGDLRTAALLFRRGTEWDPHAAGLFNNLGAAYLRQGEFEDAARAFDEGLRQNPRSFELLFNYGQACARKELYERAERLFRQALILRPDAPEVHYELGRVFAAQAKDAAARMAFARYLEMEPSSSRRPQIEALLKVLKGGPESKEAPGPAPGARGTR